MIRRRWLWQAALVLAGLAFVLPLWIGSGRADPLFLLPLTGAMALSLTHPTKSFTAWLGMTARLLGAAFMAMTVVVWLVSGAWGIDQTALLLAMLWVLAMLHQGIAALRHRALRIGWHAVVVLLWFPVGWQLADAAYRWPVATERPAIAVSSSLSLFWGNGLGDPFAALSGDARPAPITEALGAVVALQPVDAITADGLRDERALLLIQPRALPPTSLVSIDQWVRGGGTIMWLSDPALDAGFDFPLGDPRNPEPTEPNGALLARWGLQLGAGASADIPRRVRIAGLPLVLRSPGRLRATGPACTISERGIVADCRIGRGRALIVADADLTDAALWLPDGADGGGRPLEWTAANAQWLAQTLRRLMRLPPTPAWAEPLWLRPRITG